jgi:DNA-binding response OmpR family regulator
VHLFRWHGPAELPAACDLRVLGWRLDGDSGMAEGEVACPLLVDRAVLSARQWLSLLGGDNRRRARLLLLGVADSDERARLLGLGVGEVCPPGLDLAEIAARAKRIAERLELGRQVVRLGALRLDLVARDGFVERRRLGLHPREFALLWRLAECPGERVAAAVLIADVWNLSSRPETNSLAVHISRLRTKLRIAGLSGLLASAADGYRLVPDGIGNSGLDLAPVLSEERLLASKDRHECATNSPPTTASRSLWRTMASPRCG